MKRKYKYLTNSDINWLKRNSYPKEDYQQVDEFIPHIKYTLQNNCRADKKIGWKTAKKLLGRDMFLSGAHRATFHWDSFREIDDHIGVFFDASEYWEKIA